MDSLNPTPKEVKREEEMLIETFQARAKAELPYFWDTASGPDQTVLVRYRGNVIESWHYLDVSHDIVGALDRLKELTAQYLEAHYLEEKKEDQNGD